MSEGVPSPEQVVAQFSIAETQELLTDLRLPATPANARRLQNLVNQLGSFEAAIKAAGAATEMRRAA